MPATDTTELARPPGEIRDGVRQALTAASGFAQLDSGDRREIAHALVRIAHAARLLDDAAAPAGRPRLARAMNAGDEFSGTAVDRMAGTTRRMLNAISFPRFVNELITGVFRAMVETNQQQLQQYIELIRGVSQSLDGFSSLSGDDNMARRWLADRFPQSFRIEEPDPEDVPDPEDEPEPARLVSIGTPPSAEALRAALSLEAHEEVPTSGGEAMVPFVRRALARNRQQMLATMIQMGMQRIVIDSGRINAAMRFHIDASSAAAEDRSTRFDTRHSIAASGSFGIGPWSASASVSSTIGYVSTNDVSTREDLTASADLNSSVELHFRTDQVPLDRLASEQTTERLRLNTLNPERELDIARQADEARLSHRRELETARASRPRLEGAPAGPAPPAAPPIGGSDSARGSGGGSGGASDRGRSGGTGTGSTGTGSTGTGSTSTGSTSTGSTGTGSTGTGSTGTGSTGTGSTGTGSTGTGSTGTGSTGTGSTGTGSTGTGSTGTGSTGTAADPSSSGGGASRGSAPPPPARRR